MLDLRSGSRGIIVGLFQVGMIDTGIVQKVWNSKANRH